MNDVIMPDVLTSVMTLIRRWPTKGRDLSERAVPVRPGKVFGLCREAGLSDLVRDFRVTGPGLGYFATFLLDMPPIPSSVVGCNFSFARAKDSKGNPALVVLFGASPASAAQLQLPAAPGSVCLPRWHSEWTLAQARPSRRKSTSANLDMSRLIQSNGVLAAQVAAAEARLTSNGRDLELIGKLRAALPVAEAALGVSELSLEDMVDWLISCALARSSSPEDKD